MLNDVSFFLSLQGIRFILFNNGNWKLRWHPKNTYTSEDSFRKRLYMSICGRTGGMALAKIRSWMYIWSIPKLVKKKRKSYYIKGTMSNRLTCKRGYKWGSIICFDFRRIATILKNKVQNVLNAAERGHGIMLLMLPRLEHWLLWSGGKRLHYFKPLWVSLLWSSIYWPCTQQSIK